MENKAYFVDVELGVLYQLSKAHKLRLEKKHPNWFDYDLDKTPDEVSEVLDFFKENGKVLGSAKNNNLFAGFVA